MTLREVYRVENAKGQGPYRPGSYRSGPATGFGHFNDDLHPCPSMDGIEHRSSSYLCGFVSRNQMEQWFTPEERVHLRAEGYMMAKYIVPSECVMDGTKQLVFDKDHADFAFRETL